MDVDSDGERVDFKDRETVEGLFMEYWDIIKEKEGLTLENLHSADAQLKKNENCKFSSDSDDSNKSEDSLLISDCDDKNDMDEQKPVSKRKRSKGQQLNRRKAKPNEEFIGWGSKCLMQFLASIGKDTGEKLSHHEVTSIINRYINENKLYLPEKKNKIVCDARLKFVVGRKTVNRHRIHDILEAHFAENLVQSEEDEFGYNSEDEEENVSVACKRQRKPSIDNKSQKKEKSQKNEVPFDVKQTFFASIVPENIKLVYLKRSLVKELMKRPETFESQVTGSFVRVKSERNDYCRRNCHELAQVTGIKKASSGENNTEVLLQISNMPEDIRICMLSDDDLSEEECEDLRQKVKSGQLKRPTLVELEEKAISLHEDITKHWIVKELALLQHLIDQANEKGWRNKLYEYMERRERLQRPEEQLRLLQKLPKVIPDVTWFEPIAEGTLKNDMQGDEGSPKSILMGSLETQSKNREDKTSSGKQHNASAPDELSEETHILAPEVQHDVLLQNSFKASPVEELPQQPIFLAPVNQSNVVATEKQNHPVDAKQESKGNQEASEFQFIELSSSDEDKSRVTIGKRKVGKRKSS
ncbi:uncharacterized protein At5g08430-like isoform X2 [Cornus florida]|nr:uncharacterized protein At5g08430-like isoform X2 [Cornus florida]